MTLYYVSSPIRLWGQEGTLQGGHERKTWNGATPTLEKNTQRNPSHFQKNEPKGLTGRRSDAHSRVIREMQMQTTEEEEASLAPI